MASRWFAWPWLGLRHEGLRSAGQNPGSVPPICHPDQVTEALDLLRQMAGPEAQFHPDQREAIDAITQDRARVLLVQRTGWGKSAVYFIATRILRDRGAGPTLLISPLLVLMRNQIDMARRIGVRAASINSANTDEWSEVFDRLGEGEIDVLLISPERLGNERFRQIALPHISNAGLVVVDEAHCISDWGHDFRPDYRRIPRVLNALPASVPILCTTATANDRVVADITNQLGGLTTSRGRLERESLVLQNIKLPNHIERLAWLAWQIPLLEGSGVVYCLTIKDARRVAEWLRSNGIDAMHYTGADETEHRREVEEALDARQVKAVVATSALGMGYDNPELAFVIHYQMPGSPIAYYQQVGRAGRQLETARVVLMGGQEDRDIQNFFIETAFPSQPDAEEIVEILRRADGAMPIGDVVAATNIRFRRVETALKVLEVDGAVTHEGRSWLATAKPWSYDSELVGRVTEQRRIEQQAMFTYLESGQCLMEFLRLQLDDASASPCGRCAVCDPDGALPLTPPSELVNAAVAFMRASHQLIGPRKQYPVRVDDKRSIPKTLQLEEGRALCLWGDPGFGALVRHGKYQDGRFSEELVSALAQMIHEWDPRPRPEWIAFIPSLRHPDLVPALAARLAEHVGIPVLPLIEKVRDHAEQKDMQNSAHQFRNVRQAFRLTGSPPDTPGFLLDDVVDSRWTLTVAGVLLRGGGSGPVLPITLAMSTGN